MLFANALARQDISRIKWNPQIFHVNLPNNEYYSRCKFTRVYRGWKSETFVENVHWKLFEQKKNRLNLRACHKTIFSKQTTKSMRNVQAHASYSYHSNIGWCVMVNDSMDMRIAVNARIVVVLILLLTRPLNHPSPLIIIYCASACVSPNHFRTSAVSTL